MFFLMFLGMVDRGTLDQMRKSSEFGDTNASTRELTLILMASGHTNQNGYGLGGLMGLAFIPVADEVTAFGDLANQMPDNLPIDEFLDYFKSTLVEGTSIGRARFPPETTPLERENKDIIYDEQD